MSWKFKVNRSPVYSFFSRGALRRRLDFNGVLGIGLIRQLLEVPLRADHQARAALHADRIHGLHRRREIHDVVAAHQILGHGGAGKVHDNLLAFLPNVDRCAWVGELHDHPACAIRTASEVDGANGAFCRRAGRSCSGARCGGLADVGAGLLAQRDDDGVAIHFGGVRHQVVDVHDDARAAIRLGGEHGVDAAGAHVETARCESQGRVRQVERDARRLVDGEWQRLRGRTAQVQPELHLLTRQCLNVDGLELDRISGSRRETGRSQCDNGHRAHYRRSYLNSDHAFVSLWPQLANANEAGRSI
jgi:hypothetical protein